MSKEKIYENRRVFKENIYNVNYCISNFYYELTSWLSKL